MLLQALIYFFICSEFFTVWTQNYIEDNLSDSLKQSKFNYILEQSVKFSCSAWRYPRSIYGKNQIYLKEVYVALIISIPHCNMCHWAIYRWLSLWVVLRANVTHSFIDIFCSSGHLCLETSAPWINPLNGKAQLIPASGTFSTQI